MQTSLTQRASPNLSEQNLQQARSAPLTKIERPHLVEITKFNEGVNTMIKNLIIALSITTTCALAKAQSENALAISKISLIPEVGSTYFHVTGLNASYRSANLIGAKARMATANQRLTASAGLQYLQAGFKLQREMGFLSFDVADIATDYLTVPLGVEYLMTDPNQAGTQYFVSGSVTSAYLLSARFKNLVDPNEKEHGIRSQMNGYDILAGAGFGARYDNAFGQFEGVLEYQKGLRNVDKHSKSSNEGFAAKIGYTIVM